MWLLIKLTNKKNNNNNNKTKKRKPLFFNITHYIRDMAKQQVSKPSKK